MQRISFPTMIITTSAFIDTPSANFHGLAVSSMTSLSVKPAPLLHFNIQIPSLSSKNLHNHDLFAVHQLKPAPASVDLVKNFSRGIRHGGTKPFENLIENTDYSIYKNAKYDSEQTVLPILKQVERVLICKKRDIFTAADHEIWVGEVVDCVVRDETNTGGLLHSNGKFFKLGQQILA